MDRVTTYKLKYCGYHPVGDRRTYVGYGRGKRRSRLLVLVVEGKSAYVLSSTLLQVRRQHFSLWQDRTPSYRTY
eukprot:scaffold88043_cov32-Attheya_sp.AAC.1